MEFNKEDAPAMGRAIYREKIRPTLGPEQKGQIVVIDVKSGDYEIARPAHNRGQAAAEAAPGCFHLGGMGGRAGYVQNSPQHQAGET